MRGTLLLSLILAVLAVIFALQNPEEMVVDLWFIRVRSSIALTLIVTFGFGILVGILGALPGRLKHRKQMKQLQRERDAARPTTTPRFEDDLPPLHDEPGARL